MNISTVTRQDIKSYLIDCKGYSEQDFFGDSNDELLEKVGYTNYAELCEYSYQNDLKKA